jgi:hypothetical protein
MKTLRNVIIITNLVVVSSIFLVLANLGEAQALTLKDNHYDKWNCCDDLNKDAHAETGDIEQHGKQNAAVNQICIAFNCEQNLKIEQNYAKDKATIDSGSGSYHSDGTYSVNIYMQYSKSASHYGDALLTAEVAGKTYVPYNFDFGQAVKKADGDPVFYIYSFNAGVLQDGDTYKICVKNLENDEKDCREVNYHGDNEVKSIYLNFPS